MPNNFARLAGSKLHDRLVSYDRDRRGHETPPLKFVQGRFVAAHVALLKYNPVLQKKLFRPLAKHSARLAKDENLSSHTVSFLEIAKVQSKALACRSHYFESCGAMVIGTSCRRYMQTPFTSSHT